MASGEQEPGLQPDDKQILAFCQWWFERCNHGVLEIGWINAITGGLTEFEQFERDDLPALVSSAVQANMVPGQSCYIRAATVRAWNGTRGRTSDADFVQAPGVWGDIDKEEDFEHARTVVSDIKPNAQVITGTVPSTRVQSWVRCSEPLVSGDSVRELNTRFHKLYGGDRSVVNPSRLMRLPGSIAWPRKEGRVAEVVRFVLPDPSLKRPRSYPVGMLFAMLPPADPEPGPAPTAGNGIDHGTNGEPFNFGFGASLSTVAAHVAAIKAGREWHNNVVRLVAHWVGQGRSSAEIMGHCEGWTLPGWTHAQTRAEVAKAIQGAREKWHVPDTDPVVNENVTEAFEATDLATLDLDSLQPRQWVYGREIIRGFVSVLASPGGTGKTAYTMVVGVSIALGRSLFFPAMGAVPANLVVHKQGNVWFYNLEDPSDELRRRIKAVLLYHKVSIDDLKGRVFLDSGRDRPLVIAIRAKDGSIIMAPLVGPMIEELKRRKMAVLIIDPFVQSHSAEENRNEEMNIVMSLWSYVASKANCAIWLVHHFRKGGQGGDAEAVRGAGAIQGAARSMYTIAGMSADEATNLGIPHDERWKYIRHDNVKQNMAAPAGYATWYQLVDVNINNANDDYPEGDHVQSVALWKPPSPWADLPWDRIDRILTRFEAGPEPGEFYSPSRQSAQWAGLVIMEICGNSYAQATGILKAWKDTELLMEGEYFSPSRRKSTGCVRLNPGKLSEMRRAYATRKREED